MKAKMGFILGLTFILSVMATSGLATAQSFQDLITTFKSIGVFEFYLPFVIVFAIIHGLLSKTQILKGGLSAIVSLSAALFIMVATPAGITFTQFFANFFSQTVVVILTIIVVVIFVTMLTSSGILPELKGLDAFKKPGLIMLFMGVFLLIAVWVFVSSGGLGIFPGQGFTNNIFGLSTNTLFIIILVVGIGLLAFFASK